MHYKYKSIDVAKLNKSFAEYDYETQRGFIENAPALVELLYSKNLNLELACIAIRNYFCDEMYDLLVNYHENKEFIKTVRKIIICTNYERQDYNSYKYDFISSIGFYTTVPYVFYDSIDIKSYYDNSITKNFSMQCISESERDYVVLVSGKIASKKWH